MSFRLMSGAIGAVLLLVAVYQLVTGSMAVPVGNPARVRSLPLHPDGVRQFALGLVCFGILLGILAWRPTNVPNGVSLAVVIGLVGGAYLSWWSAIRTWKRERQSKP